MSRCRLWAAFASAPVVVALTLCVGVWHAAAASNQRDMVREGQIEQELAQKHPELLEPFRGARIAFDNKDYALAERLLREITAKYPDYDVALRRLGSSLVLEGKRAEGLALCERALALNRSSENLSTMAYNLVGEQSVEDHRADHERALQLLHECRTLPRGNDFENVALTAQVALGLRNAAEFESAVAFLSARYPKEVATHYFAAIAAALQQHWVRAENEMKKAEKLGLPHEAAQRFLDSGIHSAAFWPRIMGDITLTLAVWAVGLSALFALGFVLSKLTLRQVEATDPLATMTGGEKLIRKLYRAVINIAGVYYYISLPIVLLLVVGIVAALLYLFLLVGQIPIKLMLLLALGALFTIIAMLKSLFIRVKASDPGRPLQRAEAEGLWQLAEEVAQSVGTRPIDEIRITPGTELAVYERGSWRQKLRNEAHRILILGTGVLNGFKQNDFRCVLAHEYGHFSNRDTAGGDIALRVRTDMLNFYFAMRAAGQATYMNAAFHFLRLYNFIFRRISHGATRLQEILADRVAAQIYGAPAFEGGLTHVIRRSIEFDAAANNEIKHSIEGCRPLQDLYVLPAPEGGKVDAELQKALNRPTTEDDTHPGPRDRFRLIARLQQPSCPPRPGEVWELFSDPEAIRREMVSTLEQRVAPHRKKSTLAAPAAT